MFAGHPRTPKKKKKGVSPPSRESLNVEKKTPRADGSKKKKKKNYN